MEIKYDAKTDSLYIHLTANPSVDSRYLIEIFWSDEDQGFIAIAPDLPGCSAFGETQQQAAAQMQDAIASWLEACAAMHRPYPNATAKPQQQAA